MRIPSHLGETGQRLDDNPEASLVAMLDNARYVNPRLSLSAGAVVAHISEAP
jgi:hypothetical protein